MDDLVETLAVGLFISLVLIVISWWFWKRYDEPSEAQIEREESIAKKQEETQMWRAVEAQMAQEKIALDQQALYERRKAEERARAIPPPVGEVSNAFAAFDVQPQPSFTEPQNDVQPSVDSIPEHELEPEVNDDDVLLAEEAIEVRIDQGFEFEQTESIPSAPDLEALAQTAPETSLEQKWPLEEEEPELTDWSDNWFQNLEEE
tara:strand:- start:1660 stop:2271 length:612 start_codon:yes stop_codon:yes gene_type:complete